MINEVIGDLLSTTECNVIAHQANLFHSFGAGIARGIREKFPEAFEADKKTEHGSEDKLGSYSVGPITEKEGTSIDFVINVYSQAGIGGQDRNTRYDALDNALAKLRIQLDERAAKGKKVHLGFPYQFGCGLANGNWGIVKAIIEANFGDAKYPVSIYILPELAAKR